MKMPTSSEVASLLISKKKFDNKKSFFPLGPQITN